MPWILSGIMSLMQYKNEIKNNLSQHDRPQQCIYCGKAHPWHHAQYQRESDRLNNSSESLNPVFIQRYYCSKCRKTFSVLPECIPPRRWYLWETQQEAILLLLLGNSARSVEKQVKPSRHTIKRWIVWLIAQFKVQKDALCSHFPSFGLFTEPVSFWKHVFNKLPLSTAMRLCYVSGVPIP